jgi:hypothetical protein
MKSASKSCIFHFHFHFIFKIGKLESDLEFGDVRELHWFIILIHLFHPLARGEGKRQKSDIIERNIEISWKSQFEWCADLGQRIRGKQG